MTAARHRHLLALAALGLLVALTAAAAPRLKKRKRAAAPKPVAARVPEWRSVHAILAERCVRCHGPASQRGGLRLDAPEWVRRGGDGGAVIVPGDAAKSDLVAVLTGAEDRPAMPPSGPRLSEREVATLRAWINAGARAPFHPPTSPESTPATEPVAVNHWAYRPPVRPPVPGAGRVPHPIDAFLGAEHQKRGLTLNPPAPPALLLRRVSVDLVGLPPTREELHDFLADTSADAYERAVDRLLASPRYGERWARHWMDVWRYSDADGRKAKADVWWSSPHLWRWRDWIVGSLNAGKGYDRMVAEMLAGDELAPGDPAALAATGFLARNWFKLDRNIWLGNTVDHTARAFLGVTAGCARCHDHKFDPISQVDYYRLRAFFEPHDVRTDPVDGETGPAAVVARAFDARPDEPTWVFARGDAHSPDKTIAITPGTPPALGGPPVAVTPVTHGKQPSTGRRLALARWVVSRENPLAARVAVNHVWARHFGRPLVENVADFGVRTAAPVHQPLLDWLAVELMEHGWSLKHLHRLIVTSAAYRAHSSALGAPAETLAADPDNQFYWRMNARRMEAEAVRDALLWLGGALDPAAGGPPIDHARGEDTGRRSLYYRYSREDKMEFLTAFDAPGVEECYRRQQSVVPQQALALENSPFVREQARRIARRLDGDGCSTSRTFVTAAFEQVLGRPPEPAEASACEAFLARQERLFADPSALTPFPPAPPPAPPDPEVLKRVPGLPLVLGTAKPLDPVPPATDPAARARESLVHALLNHNDFITVR